MGYYFAVTAIILFYSFSCYLGGSVNMYELKNANKLYKDFIKRYNRTFKDETDYTERYDHFVQTLRYINSINAQAQSQQKVMLNKFADLSNDERRAVLKKTTKLKDMDPELKTILRIHDEPEPNNKRLKQNTHKSHKGTFVRHDNPSASPFASGIRSYV